MDNSPLLYVLLSICNLHAHIFQGSSVDADQRLLKLHVVCIWNGCDHVENTTSNETSNWDRQGGDDLVGTVCPGDFSHYVVLDGLLGKGSHDPRVLEFIVQCHIIHQTNGECPGTDFNQDGY